MRQTDILNREGDIQLLKVDFMGLFSKRASATPASPIRSLAPAARKREQEGKKVWYLNIGQPDDLAPDSFYQALNSFKSKPVGYAPSEGLSSLRESWSEFINKSVGTKITPDQMVITTGASEALLFAFAACCDAGEEVVIFDPTYANYIGISTLAGVRLKPILTEFSEGFALPPLEEVKKRLGKKTKAVLLCSPNNPTGSHYGESDVLALSNFCKENGLFLIVDETYREIVFDGAKPFSILGLDGDHDHVIMIDSVSKRFSLCGARIGCVVSTNKDLIQYCWNMASTRLASPSIAQEACASMIDSIMPDYLASVAATFQARRDALLKACAKIEGLEIYNSKGAFYTIIELPVDDAESFANWIVKDFDFEDETIFIAPARGFYSTPDQAVNRARLAFVLEPKELERAMQVLGEGIKVYNS